MNKYKRTFSQIRPSEETIERIFEMSEKKSRRMKSKGLIAVLVCLAALLCGTLTANAATDGALFEGISLIVNGENVDLKDYITNYKTYKTDDGTEVSEFEMEVPDENGNASIEIEGSVIGENQISEKEKTDDHSITYEITE